MKPRWSTRAWGWALVCLLFVVEVNSAVGADKVSPPPRQQWSFAAEGVTFDSQFPGARLNECTTASNGVFLAIIRPENEPINNSPWFAFRVSSIRPRTIMVRMKVEGGRLRYRPKISVDGRNWVLLPGEAFEKGPAQNEGTLKLEVGPEPLWVAAQELVSRERIESWARTLERLPYVTSTTIGPSMRGTSLVKLEIGEGAKDFIIIVGRQHPPETTGTLALMKFVETIASDSDLARSFRKQFTIEVFPLLNPDGVDDGHWRHNLGGVDLNRDWGTFLQPETRAVRDQVLALQKTGQIWLHLDFHSTDHDVFYTQTDDKPATPAGFTKAWIDAIQRRFPDYKVTRSSTRTPTLTTSHNWAHLTFGIPAVTYEIGDETDRALLQQIATGAAEEMMRRLLELKSGR